MLPYYEKHQATFSMRGLRPNFRFPGHLHIQCELIWVKKGKMPMICENKEYEVGEGELFIIFPNQIHAYLGSSEDVEGYILMFHPEEAAELRGSLLQTKPQHPWLKSTEVEECLRYALDWLAREKSNEAVARALLSLIMVKLYEKIEPVEKSASRESDLIRKAMQRIHETYCEEITLAGLARELGINRYHLSHLFSSYLKMGYCAYVNALRAEKARRLLLTTDHTVTEIAYDCGFNNQATFNRVFREYFHKTPRQMRSQNL